MPRPDVPVLLLAAGGIGAVLAGIARIDDPALPPVLGVAMLLGAAFVWQGFGFTGGFRVFLTQGDGRALGASLLVPAIAALVIVPLGRGGGDYIRFVAPVGVSLIAGAMVFGIGMQISNGCGSGTMVAAGEGSRRMWVTLPFFCLGGVLGSLLLPAALRLPGLGAIDLPDLLGPWGGLAATEGLLLLTALAILRGARPSRRQIGVATLIGLLTGALFLVSGEPWGITMGLTLWGAKAARAAGIDLTGYEFWADGWNRALLDGPVLAMHGGVSDIGLLLGALLTSAVLGRTRFGARIGPRGALGAALGGLLMGIGARLSFGCNVGAFIGGASSGSLHGFVWMIAALPGCWLGIRLRPWFGFT